MSAVKLAEVAIGHWSTTIGGRTFDARLHHVWRVSTVGEAGLVIPLFSATRLDLVEDGIVTWLYEQDLRE